MPILGSNATKLGPNDERRSSLRTPSLIRGVAAATTLTVASSVGLAPWVAVHVGPANATAQTPAIAVGPLRLVDSR